MIERQNAGEKEARVDMAQAELDKMLAREYSRGWEMAEPCRKENEKLKTALRACRALIDAILYE